MKIVLINSWYAQGSTGYLVKCFRDRLLDCGHEARVYYGRGTESEDAGVRKIGKRADLFLHAFLARSTGMEGCFSTFRTRRMLDEIDAFSPDVVYLFNLHAYYLNEYLLLRRLKEKKYKVVYVLFDEYAFMGKCCFSMGCDRFQTECGNCPNVRDYPKSWIFDRSKKLFLEKKEIFSDWKELTLAGVEFLKIQAKRSAIASHLPFETLNMGIDMQKTFLPVPSDELRRALGIGAKQKVALTVCSSSDRRKGTRFFYETARLCQGDDVVFIQVGMDEKIKNLPANFIGIPYVSDLHELCRYFSLADLYLTTSFGEAMALVYLESLACGTPIAGFDVSGVPYTASREFLKVVPFGDTKALADVVRSFPRKTQISADACRNYALEHYALSDFTRRLCEIGGVSV